MARLSQGTGQGEVYPSLCPLDAKMIILLVSHTRLLHLNRAETSELKVCGVIAFFRSNSTSLGGSCQQC